MSTTSTDKMDPSTAEIQKFFVSQLGNLAAASGISLNFEPMARPIAASDFLDSSGTYNQTLADEYFSINIADRPAHVFEGIHYSHQLVSISELIEANVLLQATFYQRGDLADHVNEKNRTTFEALLDTAAQRMQPTRAMLSDQPRNYRPSNASPKHWCNPSVASDWQRFSKTFVSTSKVEESTVDHTENPIFQPSFKLPWRAIDPAELLKLVKRLKVPKPQGPFPFPGINELDAVPPWIRGTPKPFTAEEIGDFGVEFLKNKSLGKLGVSGLTPSRTPLSGVRLDVLDELKRNGNLSGPGHNVSFGNLQHSAKPSDIRHRFDSGNLQHSSNPGNYQHSPDFDIQDIWGTGPQLTIDQMGGVSVEDFDTIASEKTALGAVLRSAALKNAVVTKESEEKDKIAVSFEYQFVSIDRPWLYLPLLQNPNWYIPGAKRGELSIGQEGQPHGVLGFIPDRIVVIRNLQIQAKFSESDRAALGASFAIGPFALDATVDLQEQTLAVPGMKILGYVDVALPMIPPRSDPQFLA